MLRITISRDSQEITFALAGRLASPWTDELDRCWREAADARRSSVVVDLTGVTFIAPEGKALLARMWRQGARLYTTGCLNKCIVEQITQQDPAE